MWTGRLETTAPRLYETPLVVLDGDEMLPLGRVPQYLLPEILLDRLSRGAYCRQNRCAYTAPRVLRPFADAALIFDREGGDWRACAGLAEARAEPCRTAAARSLYLQKKVFELVE